MILIGALLLPLLTSAVVNYTVSGISSGGYMTGQLHVSHSSNIKAVGIVAAGPYYCTQDSFERANTYCTYNDSPLDVAPMIAYANSMSAQGKIDKVSNLANSTVYIYSGSKDELILPTVLQGTYNFYKAFVPTSQITFVTNIPGNHAWPTKNKGNPCWYYGIAYNNQCGYDGSGIILTTLLGPLYQGGVYNASNLFTFPQSKYANLKSASMDVNGYIYVPVYCQSNPDKCVMHVNIHGCVQNYDSVGLRYIEEIGMNEWAEANNIILIYPQAINSADNYYYGCWDLWGYTGSNYCLKTAIQVNAIHSMAQDYINIVKTLFK